VGRTWVLALLCAACARGTGAGGSASFSVSDPDAVRAKATKGKRFYAFEDGVIGGVPKQAGDFKATIERLDVTCAGTPYEGQVVDVQIAVT